MVMHPAHHRPAIAMIELIFAIVVMGIVMMSAPMMMQQTLKTTTVALQQEGVNEAAARVNMILTYPWDQRDTNSSCIPPVLTVTHGDPELDEVGTTARRAGVDKNSSSHTFLCNGNRLAASSTLGSDSNDSNDIDDFIGTTSLTIDTSGSGGTDYNERSTVSINTAVTYAGDSANYNHQTITYAPATGTATSNVKEIKVTLTSTSTASELGKTRVLRAFSCNVGGFQYEKRTF